MKWNKRTQRLAYKGFRSILNKTFELPNGSLQDFDVVTGHSFASIAAQTESGHFLILEQYRPGPERFLKGFPAGHIDAGESPETAAARELLEETGYAAGEMNLLKSIQTAYSEVTHYCFLATACRKVGDMRPEDDEFLRLKLYSLAELKALLRDRSDDSFYNLDAAYLALDYLKLL